MNPSSQALRPYLETIDKLCRSLDRDSLRQCILNLAKQVKRADRQAFLKNLCVQLPGSQHREVDTPKAKESFLLSEIEEFRKEIGRRIESIEDGSYWDDADEDDWYHSDEAPDLLDDAQRAALADFFQEADREFLKGKKAAAKEIYAALFALIDEIDSDTLLPDIDTDLREARARFARCVYENSHQKERIKALLQVMRKDVRDNQPVDYYLRDLPLLQDIIDAEPGDLAEFDSFLASWQTALGKEDIHRARIADLQLEATFLQRGVAAVGELARIWGKRQPRGYLYWLRQLEREELWARLRDAAGETLAALPNGQQRGQAAALLITAGKKMNENDAILTGYREQFRSQPSEWSLLKLAAEAGGQRLRKEELDGACSFLSGETARYHSQGLLERTFIMAGRIDEAFTRCRQHKAVGWSSGNGTGLVFAALLYLLSGGNAACTLVRQLLQSYSRSEPFYDVDEDELAVDPTPSGLKEIMAGLDQANTVTLPLDDYRQWTGKIAEKRVSHILDNQHRGAYDRAATVLGALAETMSASGETLQAQVLLHQYCRVLYNRHSTFRRKMREAVGRSQTLRGMGSSL